MKFSQAILITFLFVSALVAAELNPAGDISTDVDADRMESTTSPGSCKVNLCFALDGSASISPKQYTLQKSIIRKVVNSIDSENEIGLSAVQYGVANIQISKFGTDREEFLGSIRDSKKENASQTFVVAGINYCFGQLFEKPGNNKIVLLGDGKRNFGGDPVERAKLFREIVGDVCAVAIGKSPNIKALTAIVGGDKDMVITADVPDNIEAVARNLVRLVCS